MDELERMKQLMFPPKPPEEKKRLKKLLRRNDRNFLLYKYKDVSTDLKIIPLENGNYLITLNHWD